VGRGLGSCKTSRRYGNLSFESLEASGGTFPSGVDDVPPVGSCEAEGDGSELIEDSVTAGSFPLDVFERSCEEA